MHAVAGARPDAPLRVEPETVEDGIGAVGEDLAARQLAVVRDPEDADVLRPVLHMRDAGVGDVEQPLVRREGEAVRAHEIVGDDADRPRPGIDAIDMAGADLALGLVALIIRVDAVGRIGEPDPAVGSYDDVVRAVEALALEAVRDHADRAVVLGAGDAPVAVLARDETAFAVDRVAVRIARRRPEHAGRAGRLVEAQHAVVRDVAPDERTLRREVGGAFGPAAALVELLYPRRDLHERPEALVQNREIAAAHGASPVFAERPQRRRKVKRGSPVEHGPLSRDPGERAATKLRRLLQQALRLQRLLHRRAGRDALHETGEVRIGLEVDVVEVRPVHDREEIGVSRGETLAGQERAARETLVEIGKTLGEVRLDNIAHRLRRIGLPQRTEALVDLGRDEGQPLLQPVALHGAARRREAGLRRLVGEVLHQRRDLGQDLAIVEAKRRDVALRVDLREGLAALGLAGGEVELVEIDLEPGLAGDDVWGERAGAGRVIKLHGGYLRCPASSAPGFTAFHADAST